MAILEIKIKNIDKLVKAFREAPKVMANELQSAIGKVGGFTVGEVKKHITAGTDMFKSPIDTGAMISGINVFSIGKLKVTIKPSTITPYAKFVHEGTKRMRARPFFDITAKRSKKEIEDFFSRALDTAVNKIVNKSK